MTSPLPLLPTSDRAAVWGRVPVPDAEQVAFICIDDGYRPDNGVDPLGAAEFVESFTPRLPVTPFVTFYAASLHGLFPPLTAPDDVAHLEYLRRFVTPGRGVQCHMRTHVDMTGVEPGSTLLTYAQQLDALNKARNWLSRNDMFGPPLPQLFRPPYGRWNDDTRRAAFMAGFRVITLWTHTYSQVLAGKEVRPGDILLCHFNGDLEDQLAAAVSAISSAGLAPAYIEDYVR